MATRLKNKLAASKEQVLEAYQNGATLRQIAELHKVSAGTIRNCLVELGVSLRPRGRRRKNNDNIKSRLLIAAPVEVTDVVEAAPAADVWASQGV